MFLQFFIILTRILVPTTTIKKNRRSNALVENEEGTSIMQDQVKLILRSLYRSIKCCKLWPKNEEGTSIVQE
jgi:hypothetical protein